MANLSQTEVARRTWRGLQVLEADGDPGLRAWLPAPLPGTRVQLQLGCLPPEFRVSLTEVGSGAHLLAGEGGVL